MESDGERAPFLASSEDRCRVLPGITGLWQVRGRGDVAFDRMMELDTEYIQKWSLILDFRILLETPLAVISARGAY